MREKRVFLHIGLHKTASTFLQDLLFPSLHGVVYISRPFTILNDHFNCLQYADDSLYDEKEIKLFFEEIDFDKLLISDENFCGKPVSLGYSNRSMIAKRLHSLFPDAEVIIFLRNQLDLLYSLYNQHVKIFSHFHVPITKAYWKRPNGVYTFSDYKKNKPFDINYLQFNSNEFYINLDYFLFSKMISFYRSIFKKVHIFLYEDFKYDTINTLNRLEGIFGEKFEIDKSKIFKKEVNSGLKDSSLKKKRIDNMLSLISSSIPSALLKLFVNDPKLDERIYLKEFIGDFYSKDNKTLIKQNPEISSVNFDKYYLQ